jgi:hypothetical protein
MRGSRRAVIAMVWLAGTTAATVITIEGVRVVGRTVINSESAINPRQASAALSARTSVSTTTTTTVAETTTVTSEATTTEAPTTAAETEAPPTTRPARRQSTTTAPAKKSPDATPETAATTEAPPPAPPTNPPAAPPTTPAPPATTARPACIDRTQFTRAGVVQACFSAQKIVVLGIAPADGWQARQLQSGKVAVVQFRKGQDTVTVTAFWNGGPAWAVIGED